MGLPLYTVSRTVTQRTCGRLSQQWDMPPEDRDGPINQLDLHASYRWNVQQYLLW